jgi:5-methylcytosine-specific restriction endonuclease McrA
MKRGQRGEELVKRKVSSDLKRMVGASQKWTCAHCHQMLPATFEVDHIIPLHEKGTNHIDNLQALCNTCHAHKSMEERITRYETPQILPIDLMDYEDDWIE